RQGNRQRLRLRTCARSGRQAQQRRRCLPRLTRLPCVVVAHWHQRGLCRPTTVLASHPNAPQGSTRLPGVLWGSKGCLRASQLCSKNSLDIRDFDYVTRFELFLAALDHGIIHFDLYLVFGSSDEVAILASVNQSCDAGSEPPL